MVKQENKHAHLVGKFFVDFLNQNGVSPELIAAWKEKQNINKFKNVLRKADKPVKIARPKSEFIFFCQFIRPEVNEELRKATGKEKLDNQQVICKLGERWVTFKENPEPELKEKISQLAKEDQLRYQKEKKENTQEEVKNDMNHFKSLYLYFCREKRLENPKISLREISPEWEKNKTNEDLIKRYEEGKRLHAQQ
ncbi:176L [Cherax quadricarinatus iridovirus]|uniref:High mobility group protein n=1 Tax=Shrimp hemocyte iridescent virus TaxID=2039780 RepID=A0A291B103_9VIRU|nr:176L [Cherax quadricarinatus iridovirus]YP_010084903.1 high mobility group protein [Shrimp hemocyte iridescent virus]UPA43320.1 high mobility group protein [Iridovirus CN01]ASZ85156.1 176L [Cherax quadricarinatus iridovirus]ATE87160.1 high mobility group protein [Shrimp hemocyte iridescent virus]UPA43555.1 high mobility group protein [Iridovirus CN01]UPA43752.1 high mobility group protein [Iridovirus CN01]